MKYNEMKYDKGALMFHFIYHIINNSVVIFILPIKEMVLKFEEFFVLSKYKLLVCFMKFTFLNRENKQIMGLC